MAALLKTSSSVLSLLVCLTIILALEFDPSHAQSSPQDYLDAHNSARSKVGVGPMVWNETVAAFAESYARQRSGDCDLIHTPVSRPYGENLAVSDADEFTAADAVDMWMAEEADYDYDSNSCAEGKMCGHYTQVVWRTSVRLGCARVQCSAGVWKWFIICSYDPAGNANGERPY